MINLLHKIKNKIFSLPAEEDLSDFKDVNSLELLAKKNAVSIHPGDYSSAFKGTGLMFHEARKYIEGEDARFIDWNMTARLGEPYVRVNLDERERDVFIALDVSPSMFTGSQKLTKIYYALELAATLSISAIRGKDNLGGCLFSDHTFAIFPPRTGRISFHHLFDAFLTRIHQGPSIEKISDPRSAIHTIQSLKGRRMLIFILSDFIDYDVPEDIKFLKQVHDVNLLHIVDPLEILQSPLLVDAKSPEGVAAASPVKLKPLMNLEDLQKSANSYGIYLHTFNTSMPAHLALLTFLHGRAGRT